MLVRHLVRSCKPSFYVHRASQTDNPQLQVTAAKPGAVNFELDVKKEHTVCNNNPRSLPTIFYPLRINKDMILF